MRGAFVLLKLPCQVTGGSCCWAAKLLGSCRWAAKLLGPLLLGCQVTGAPAAKFPKAYFFAQKRHLVCTKGRKLRLLRQKVRFYFLYWKYIGFPFKIPPLKSILFCLKSPFGMLFPLKKPHFEVKTEKSMLFALYISNIEN